MLFFSFFLLNNNIFSVHSMLYIFSFLLICAFTNDIRYGKPQLYAISSHSVYFFCIFARLCPLCEVGVFTWLFFLCVVWYAMSKFRSRFHFEQKGVSVEQRRQQPISVLLKKNEKKKATATRPKQKKEKKEKTHFKAKLSELNWASACLFCPFWYFHYKFTLSSAGLESLHDGIWYHLSQTKTFDTLIERWKQNRNEEEEKKNAIAI